MGYYEPEVTQSSTDQPLQQREPEAFPLDGVPAGITFILPDEYKLALAKIAGMESHQEVLSAALGDAMDQSSETFHDNAPQEAVVAESTVLVERAKPIIKLLRSHRIAGYPEDAYRVSIGTRVKISINGGPEFEIDVVGASWLHDDDPSEVEKTSYSAPIVSGILGSGQGDEVVTTINGKALKIKVLGIQI